MREYDRAIGCIASCCSTVNASYRGYQHKQGRHIIEVKYRNGIFSIVTTPTDSFFRAISARQLSNVDGFDITRSEPIGEAKDRLKDLFDDIVTSNIRVDYLVEEDGSSGREYFDGFRTIKPLYVYRDEFGPKEFDESLSELNQIGRKAFNSAIDELAIELDDVDKATGSKDEPEKAYARAFQ